VLAEAVNSSTGTVEPNFETTESELIQPVRRGETEAFYSLVQPCERSVFIAAMSILHNPADAEEVAQEAVLKAFSAMPRFRHEVKFSTWLIQITINEARLKIRKDRRHRYQSIDEDKTDEQGDYFPKDFDDWREIPSEALHRKYLREALKRALNSLGPKYREVFVLRDVQHLTIKDTAQVLGITEESVKTRLLRARLQMRDALARGIDGTWSSGKQGYEKVRPW